MLNLLKKIFPSRPTLVPQKQTFVITARRWTLPPNAQPVFGSFVLEAVDSFQAAREFDTVYTKWARLDVTKR